MPANVIILDVIIPEHFFTADYLRYLPYIKYSHYDSKVIFCEKLFIILSIL
jgi:hypothetical protein